MSAMSDETDEGPRCLQEQPRATVLQAAGSHDPHSPARLERGVA